jgi:hypothetical protein
VKTAEVYCNSLVLKGVTKDGYTDTVETPLRPPAVTSVQEEGNDSSKKKAVELTTSFSRRSQQV